MNILSNPTFFHPPVSVFRVRFVPVVLPPRTKPASTFPPATGRDRWFLPEATVKLASGRSQALAVATLGEPGVTSVSF
jgi:hypothetical protein